MPWVKFDDQFPIHRKVAGLSDAAFRQHVSAIFWSARNLTDGFLPREDLDDVCARVRTPERFAAECVKRGLWHLAAKECDGEKCPPPVDKPGWRIHDFFEYQPSKEQVMRDRAAARKRQERWKAKQKQRGNAVSNAVTDAVRDAAPPRPSLKGMRGGETAPAANGRAAPRGRAAQQSKPPWCGTCNQNTRMLDDPPMRCPRCHPLATGIEADSWRATHREIYG